MSGIHTVADELRVEQAELTALLNRERRLPQSHDRDSRVDALLTLLHDLERELANDREPRV